MSEPVLSSDRFLLTTNTYGTPLVSVMKRYRRTSGNGPGPKDLGLILLFAHGAGFPKEIWEPTLEDLFRFDDAGDKQHIREGWALDCQNHGEAGVLNGKVLARNPGSLTIWDYADSFATLYKSGLLGPIDPHLHKVVMIGHSAGSVGVTLATSYFNPPSTVPFSLILIDPPMASTAFKDQESDMYQLVAAMTPMRKDRWDSLETAKNWLRARPPCDAWDERVFEVFIKYGIQPLPTPYYPDPAKYKGVTLTTHRSEENVAFTGKRFAPEAVNRLNQICSYVPVHLVFGEQNDLFEREVQDSLADEREGRVFASVTRVEGAGHLVVQEAPTNLAKVLVDILRAIATPVSNPVAKSKL